MIKKEGRKGKERKMKEERKVKGKMKLILVICVILYIFENTNKTCFFKVIELAITLTVNLIVHSSKSQLDFQVGFSKSNSNSPIVLGNKTHCTTESASDWSAYASSRPSPSEAPEDSEPYPRSSCSLSC